MSEEDMPPEYMWPFVEALNDWFLEVRARHKMSSHGGGSDDDEDLSTTFKNTDPRIAALRRN